MFECGRYQRADGWPAGSGDWGAEENSLFLLARWLEKNPKAFSFEDAPEDINDHIDLDDLEPMDDPDPDEDERAMDQDEEPADLNEDWYDSL